MSKRTATAHWRWAAIGALAIALVVLRPQAAAAETTTSAMAVWSNGQGNCGSPGSGEAANGTGFFEAFQIDTTVVLTGEDLTVDFIQRHNGKSILEPVKGKLGINGNFRLAAHQDSHDEDYTFEGRARSSELRGTYTRLAHYYGSDNSGPRCTATWDVVVTFTTPLELPNRPRTQEKVPTAAPTQAAPGGAGDASGGSGGIPWVPIGGIAAAAAAVGVWVRSTRTP